jgi:hypothetical protein
MSQSWIAEEPSMRSAANLSQQIRRKPAGGQKIAKVTPKMDYSVKSCRLTPIFHSQQIRRSPQADKKLPK